MSRSWKSLGLALAAVLGVVLLLPGGAGRQPPTAFAAGTQTITLNFDTDPEGGTGLPVTVSSPGGCDLSSDESSFTASDGTQKVIDCTGTSGTFTISFSLPSGWSMQGNTTCSGGNPSFSASSIQLTLTDNASVTCSVNFEIPAAGTATPTATGTPGTATPTATPTATGTPQVATVTVSVAPSSLNCTGSAFVTVVAKNSAGSPIAGGSVTLSTTLGVISPTTATDTGAGVLAVLSGNGVGGTATITANVSGVTGTATAQINCAAATATPVPPTAVPQQPSSPRPPNTGDAGLLGRGSTPRVALGLLLIGLAFAGTLGMAWRRVHS
jgi:hypothetical protein